MTEQEINFHKAQLERREADLTALIPEGFADFAKVSIEDHNGVDTVVVDVTVVSHKRFIVEPRMPVDAEYLRSVVGVCAIDVQSELTMKFAKLEQALGKLRRANPFNRSRSLDYD